MLRSTLPLVLVLAAAVPAFAAPRSGNEITGLAFTPDGKTLISVSLDNHIRFIDAARQKERLHVEAHKDGIYGLALSADGRWLVTAGGDRKVRLWDVAKVKEVAVFEGHDKAVYAVAISPDAKLLASGGLDSTVRIWDVASGKEKHVLKGHEIKVTSLAFSGDGSTLASGGVSAATLPGIMGLTQGDRVRLWNPLKGEERRVLEQRGEVVAFTPDGRWLTSAGMFVSTTPAAGGGISLGGGSRVAFWDLARGRELPPLEGHRTALTFSRWPLLCHGLGQPAPPRRTHHLRRAGAKGHPSLGLAHPRRGVEHGRCRERSDGAGDFSRRPTARRRQREREHALLRPGATGWDAARARGLDDAKLRFRIDALGEKSPAAYEAIWTLTAAGDRGTALLKDRLKPVQPAGDRVRKLIDELDSDQFNVRDNASKELAKLGSGVEAELRQALEKKEISLEFRRKVEALLEGMHQYPSTPEELRQSRAVTVLERIQTPAAHEVLETLAKGTPGAGLTRDARESLPTGAALTFACTSKKAARHKGAGRMLFILPHSLTSPAPFPPGAA